MAADDVESVVVRWFVDYYVSLALAQFENDQYADFCQITSIIKSVLDRPCEVTDALQVKIQVLKFLCYINEGERLDVPYEFDDSLVGRGLSPLCSALILLEQIIQELNIPPQDFENVCTSLKEMIVAVFIKNNEFDKAKEVLNQHFPKSMVGKKAIFMGLIRTRNKTHPAVEEINFHRFKKEMSAFCRSLCPVHVPFLHKAAQALCVRRLDEVDGPDEQDEPGPSTRPQTLPCQAALRYYTINVKSRLEAAYKSLASSSDDRTFTELEEEEPTDLCLCLSPSQELEQNTVFQRAGSSPMEASPADPPADPPPDTNAVAGSCSRTSSVVRKRRPYTVARLVVEPDSQQSSQCTVSSQDVEAVARTEELPESSPIPSQKDPQSPIIEHKVPSPTRKRRRQTTNTCMRSSGIVAQESADSEEELPGSVVSGETSVEKLHDQPNSSLSRTSNSEGESPAFFTTPTQTPQKQQVDESVSKQSCISLTKQLTVHLARTTFQHQDTEGGSSTNLRQSSSDREEDAQDSSASSKSPVQTPRKQPVKKSLRKRGRVSPPKETTDHVAKNPLKHWVTGRRKSKRVPTDLKDSPAPVQTPQKDQAQTSLSNDADNSDDISIIDSSLESSSSKFFHQPVPQTSSTPHRDSPQDTGCPKAKWNKLIFEAKESKETWSDEEMYFDSKKDASHGKNTSTSSHRKKKWTPDETKRLIEGVKKFGEGNWSKIKSHCSFKNRTNVNLKDRWRTMKNLKMV